MADPFPERLRYWRLQRGYSQTQLSWRSEITPTQISRLERGVQSPSLDTVKKLAGALDITVDDLIEPNGEAA